jgi:hypothetical protein
MCPQSLLGVLKNCGVQTKQNMRFAADYSETLEVLFDANRWNKRPSLRFSVVYEMATVQERALYGMAF